MKIESLDKPAARASLCRDILQFLPEWFGIPASIDEYVQGAADQEMLVCRLADRESPAGFLSLRFHTPAAAEAYVLGVRREWHRRGCGRALFAEACVS